MVKGGSCEVCFSREGNILVYAPGGGIKSRSLCADHAEEWSIDLGQPLARGQLPQRPGKA
jgi:hypothetical protein